MVFGNNPELRFFYARSATWSTALKEPSSPYDVGYGKPPDATKFGKRPQPQRRPRKEPQLPNILSLLTDRVEVSRDGKAEKLHPHEVMMLSLGKRALKRELRAIKAFLKECKKAGMLEPPPAQRTCGVAVCPKWMPMEMFCLLGDPPWDASFYDPIAAKFEETLKLYAEWFPGAREKGEHEHRVE